MEDGSAHGCSTENPLHECTNPLHECTDCDADGEIVKKSTQKEANRIIAITCICVAFSYTFGLFGVTSSIPVMLCCYIFWLIKDKVSSINLSLIHDHERREHTRRALKDAETVEWLNTLLNRWWCFSDASIDELMKRAIDPTLESCKPKMIESIELSRFTLGNRTPYLTDLKLHDMTEDLRFKKVATDITCRNPPPDIGSRLKYQIAVDADMGLDAPQSQLCIRIKLIGKLGYTDVVVDQFKLRGRLQLVLFFNESIAFPHLTAFSFSFLRVPKIDFGIKLLKSIKLMEFSSIRSWIEDLVNDLLETSLVSPGQVTVPLCSDPGVLGRQQGYASGVLTLTIQGGEHGKATNDTQWCSVTMDKEKIRTQHVTNDAKWKGEMSFLIHSLQFDKLRIKIKAKRMLGPNYTVVEYVLPLFRLNLEQEPVQEMTLEDDNIPGSDLKVSLDYSSLPFLELSNATEEESFQTNYLANSGAPDEVAGVLFVRVHKGIDLIPMDVTGTSDPYVMIFANSERKHVGHVIKETLNPEWETLSEFFTLDYTGTTLTFIVYDSDRSSALSAVLSTAEEDDFMGSCNMTLSKDEWCVFKRPVDVLYKIRGDLKRGINETMRKVGKLIISVVFRPVSAIKKTVEGTKGSAMPEGEPLYQKHTKIDAVTVEAMMRSERGSLTISILRARNLIALDMNGRSDPFVSIRVGNSNQEKYKSKVIPRTLNPVWNEEVTLAMLQKHEKMSIELFDKDAFTQERMGLLTFDYSKLLEVWEEDEGKPRWFTLNEAKSGEVQLAFKVVPPESAAKSNETTTSFKSVKTGLSLDETEQETATSSSMKNDSEDSEGSDEFLVYEDNILEKGSSSKQD